MCVKQNTAHFPDLSRRPSTSARGATILSSYPLSVEELTSRRAATRAATFTRLSSFTTAASSPTSRW